MAKRIRKRTYLDEKKNEVTLSSAKKGKFYYCKETNKEVFLKGGNKVKLHFCERKNVIKETWHLDKSDYALFYSNNFYKKSRNIILTNKDNISHIVRLIVGTNILEFQSENITREEFDERNDFYIELGFNVSWIFDLKEALKENNLVDSFSGDNIFVYKKPKEPFINYKKREHVDIYFEIDGIRTKYLKLNDFLSENGDIFSATKINLSQRKFINHFKTYRKTDLAYKLSSFKLIEDNKEIDSKAICPIENEGISKNKCLTCEHCIKNKCNYFLSSIPFPLDLSGYTILETFASRPTKVAFRNSSEVKTFAISSPFNKIKSLSEIYKSMLLLGNNKINYFIVFDLIKNSYILIYLSDIKEYLLKVDNVVLSKDLTLKAKISKKFKIDDKLYHCKALISNINDVKYILIYS